MQAEKAFTELKQINSIYSTFLFLSKSYLKRFTIVSIGKDKIRYTPFLSICQKDRNSQKAAENTRRISVSRFRAVKALRKLEKLQNVCSADQNELLARDESSY